MRDCVIVDSHQHFWNPVVFPMPDLLAQHEILNQAYLPERLKPELDKAGVDWTIFVQGLPQTLENTCWMFDLAEKADFVAGVVAWADLTRPEHLTEVIDDLQKCPKFCGVRHIVELEADEDWLVREEVLVSLKELARRRIPYDMLVKPRHLFHVLHIAREIPELPMVLDHMGKPDIASAKMAPWAKAMSEIARLRQVYCKISGIVAEARSAHWRVENLEPYVEHVLGAFGPERLMFGSDWPLCNLGGDYQRVWETINELLRDVPETEQQEIFGKNAVRFYKLKECQRASEKLGQ